MTMMRKQVTASAATISTFAALALAGTMLIRAPHARADEGNNEESEIQQGFAIAPVPLNLAGKDRALVGLGSYIVNGQGDCNGCHTLSSSAEYTGTGNPHLL